ncbi:MAG: hypothetical protein UZ15_CFX003003025 [Chloroflexi bacterium OLB15]|nr:MAG: hypothetical protein UZ15_CFX003003025 [Chloroflexi bacterium OLB15]
MPSNDPLDLNLIQMVQRARMAHDAEAVPSEAAGVYWVEAKREIEGKEPTSRAGVWVVPTTTSGIDALWATIKQATREGKLGYKSKAATASRSLGVDQADRVIHVLTYDPMMRRMWRESTRRCGNWALLASLRFAGSVNSPC